MRGTRRRIVAWGVAIGLAAVWGFGSAAAAADAEPTDAPPVSAGGAVWFEPPAGTVGQKLQLIGLGFPPNTDVFVTTTASPDPTLAGRSAGDGTFTLPYTIPALAPGQHTVDVRVGNTDGSLQLLVLPPQTEPTPTPTESEAPPADPTPTVQATAPEVLPAPGPSASSRPELARSGVSDPLGLLPWGLAALAAATLLGVNRSRRRAGVRPRR